MKIKAKNDKSGKVQFFPERTWKIGRIWLAGWTKLGEVSDEVAKAEEKNAKTGDIEMIDLKDVKTKPITQDKAPETDEIKKYLKERNIYFHHATGRVKLVKKYLEVKAEEVKE